MQTENSDENGERNEIGFSVFHESGQYVNKANALKILSPSSLFFSLISSSYDECACACASAMK